MVGDSGSEEDKESHSPNCILGASTDCREKMSELRNTASDKETFNEDFESTVLWTTMDKVRVDGFSLL